MSDASSPANVVQRQFAAYNAKDLDAWLATYAPDARQFEHPDKLLASGHAEIRPRGTTRFADPLLHARLIQRTVYGNLVVDHEELTLTLPKGPGRMELVCLYIVANGLIQTASFIFGTLVPDLKG